MYTHRPAPDLPLGRRHGTNLGIAAMGYSTEGVSVDMLHHVSCWFLREETLRAAAVAVRELFKALEPAGHEDSPVEVEKAAQSEMSR